MEQRNIHEGHRRRLTQTALSAGIENLSEIQAIEVFLTYIFPRGDVNPLAHRLIDKFGNFANIIDADINELTTVPGINKRSATMIKLFNDFFFHYANCKMDEKINLNNTNAFLDFIEQLLRFKQTENLIFLGIDNSFNINQKRQFDLKKVRAVGIDPLELFSFISSAKPAYLVVMHNHPGGSARPSPNDHEAVQFIDQLLENVECKLLDSLIVGNDGIYSERRDGYMRKFVDNIVSFIS